jgi:hypothetical protein
MREEYLEASTVFTEKVKCEGAELVALEIWSEDIDSVKVGEASAKPSSICRTRRATWHEMTYILSEIHFDFYGANSICVYVGIDRNSRFPKRDSSSYYKGDKSKFWIYFEI